MTQFLDKADLIAAKLPEALSDLGTVTTTNFAENLSGTLPNALNTALPTALSSALPSALTGALPDALTTALPTALPATLPAVGLATTAQTNLTTANGGNFNPAQPAIPSREDFRTVEGDRASFQESVNRAVTTGRKFDANATTTTVLTAGLTLPNNFRYEGQYKQLQAGTGLTSGYLATTGDAVNFSTVPYGYLNNLYLQQPFATDASGSHVDHNKSLDGHLINNTNNQVHMSPRIRGFRYGQVFDGNNNYIQSTIGGSISANWLANVLWKSSVNSGERMVWSHMSLSDARNPSQTAVSVYIDPTSSDQDFYIAFTSLSYNDRDLFVPHGQVTLYGCHQESNSNQPRIQLTYTSSRSFPVVTHFGGSIASGPNLSWTNKSPYNIPLEWTTGRAALDDMLTSRTGKNYYAPLLTSFHTYNTTEVLRDVGKSVQHNASFHGLLIDTGYQQHNATLGSGNAPLGRGMGPTLSFTHGNCLLIPTGNTTTGMTITGTGATNFVSDTVRALNVDGNSRKLDRTAGASTEISQASYLLQSVTPGQNLYYETSVHIDGYVDGFAGLNLKFYADMAGTVPVTGFFGAAGIDIEGIRSNTGVSSTGATITIPDPTNAPNVGLYTPGTMQSGAVTLGDDLSGTGITGRCFVAADNGNGTWLVDIANTYGSRAAPVAVAATTIYHWRRVAGKVPIPEGCRSVLVSEQVRNISGRTNIQGLFQLSRTRMHLA